MDHASRVPQLSECYVTTVHVCDTVRALSLICLYISIDVLYMKLPAHTLRTFSVLNDQSNHALEVAMRESVYM